MSAPPTIRVVRVYDQPSSEDGVRVLVDRLWPRGVRKDTLHLDEWCKQIAPSSALRGWYGHSPDRFTEFSRRYRAELDDPEHAAPLVHLASIADHGPLALLTATKRVEISHASVLAAVLAAR
jgi:uncharacterized protein YeaO (DUF488 family)